MRCRRARDNASMSEPRDRCDHSGPIEVERVEGCYRAWCTVCGKTGPARKTPEAARKALVVLGARDGTTTPDVDPRATNGPTRAPGV